MTVVTLTVKTWGRCVQMGWDIVEGFYEVRSPEPFSAPDPTAWFDHHERGHNRTWWFNRSPSVESGA